MKEPRSPVYNVPTPCGSPIKKIYKWNEDHSKLVEAGEVDIQEQLNAAAVGCGVYGIIDRIMHGANIDLPEPTDGQFLDVSGMSQMTLGDAFAAQRRVNQAKAQEQATAEASKAPEQASDTARSSLNPELQKYIDDIVAIKAKLGIKDE